MAGICAAIAAAENNASVVVIDRASGGGATAISRGCLVCRGWHTATEAGGIR